MYIDPKICFPIINENSGKFFIRVFREPGFPCKERHDKSYLYTCPVKSYVISFENYTDLVHTASLEASWTGSTQIFTEKLLIGGLHSAPEKKINFILDTSTLFNSAGHGLRISPGSEIYGVYAYHSRLILDFRSYM